LRHLPSAGEPAMPASLLLRDAEVVVTMDAARR
jgi:hypothetical protein